MSFLFPLAFVTVFGCNPAPVEPAPVTVISTPARPATVVVQADRSSAAVEAKPAAGNSLAIEVTPNSTSISIDAKKKAN